MKKINLLLSRLSTSNAYSKFKVIFNGDDITHRYKDESELYLDIVQYENSISVILVVCIEYKSNAIPDNIKIVTEKETFYPFLCTSEINDGYLLTEKETFYPVLCTSEINDGYLLIAMKIDYKTLKSLAKAKSIVFQIKGLENKLKPINDLTIFKAALDRYELCEEIYKELKEKVNKDKKEKVNK